MKLVIGIVRPEKANDVLEALYRADVRGLSLSRVQGHGGELDRVETYRGTTVQMGLAEKVRFEIAVSEPFVAAHHRRPLRGRADRRGRRRQDLRGAAGAGGAHPHRRDRPRRRDPGAGLVMAPGPGPGAQVDTGDTAWMLVATALVLLMTPALGLFYAGLVRSKNTLNTFMMCVAAIAVATVTWAAVGYSLAFGDGNGFIGGFGYAVPERRRLRAARRTPTIPHLLFFAFQATFCIITTALVSGAVVERMRFGPFLVFAALWSVLVYAVLAHWAFGGGWLQAGGTLDFAGGIPVEMGSGFSALAAALVVRRAQGLRPPGAAAPQRGVRAAGRRAAVVRLVRLQRRQRLLDRRAQRAGVHQHAADARRARCWSGSLLDLIRSRKVTAIGAATAIIVGCVRITPAGGFISPGWAMAAGRAWPRCPATRSSSGARARAWTRRSTCWPRTASPA